MSNIEDTFPKKKRDKLPAGFQEEADSLDVNALKKVIVDSENNLYSINKAKENDANLISAKEEVKNIAEPYKDAANAQRAKIEYVTFLLRQKGELLDNTDI
jgi:hypothetical protein